jgi:hypothetical protein
VTWILALFVLALTLRLFAFVDRYTVNLFYWDQWEFLGGLFDGADYWTLFRWQHGPQRQGLGNLIMAVVLWATEWDARAIAFAAAAVALLTALASLWLVKRVCKTVMLWDAAVPLIFLTTANYGTYTGAANLAHGPLPALFLVAFALTFTVPSHTSRAALIVLVSFFAINTGFTMLLSGITPVVLVLWALQPGLGARERAAYGAALILSLAIAALFFRGFVFMTAVDCYEFPHDRPWQYVSFIGRLLARPFNPAGRIGSGAWHWHDAVALASAAGLFYAGVQALRSRGASTLWNVASLLMAFTMAFAIVTAIGRVCLGLDGANSARYIPYVLPGILAVLMVLRSGLPAGRWRTAALGVFVLLCVVKETSRQPRGGATADFAIKQAWRDCYLTVHDIARCDERAGGPTHPNAEAVQLQQKLDWLEARRFNLFQDRRRPFGSR